MTHSELKVGIDIGGTFTDFVVADPETGALDTFKLLSTPHDPSEAVLKGLRIILSRGSSTRASLPSPGRIAITHGSTVATNALLERKGAVTALVTTRGFRDVLQIGRQDRPALYDFAADPPPPLVPDALRFEVDERIDSQGQVIQPLEAGEIDRLVQDLGSSPVESVAICLLFSFLHPQHEQAIAGRLRAAGYFVSPSCEILPEYREYERASTTVVNAYVTPILDRYLARLESAPLAEPDRQLLWRVMQSNGGNISLNEARRAGVRCILSGPAGGLVGARHIAVQALSLEPQLATQPSRIISEANERPERLKIITFDMGGTSTDVSLIDGEPGLTTESVVGDCPIRIPVLDIHTIGAGGGSIARVDLGGALRVGPESAGADPGPACYGIGELSHSQPTVTDANLVLGRLQPDHFLGSQMPLDASRARYVFARLGDSLGLDPVQAALGVIEVANAHMERALRLISVERGYDPREFTLLSFGGAGGLHAADLARRLAIPRLLVPPLASTLSAFGMLAADVAKDYTQTVMLSGDTPLSSLENALAPLVERGSLELLAEGVPAADILIERSLDMRYRGQSYELSIPFGDRLIEDFHRIHHHTYGYARPEAPLQIVNLRVRARGRVTPPNLHVLPSEGKDPAPARVAARSVVFPSGEMQVPLIRGELLRPANRITGPAVVFRSDTTILIGPSDHAEVDAHLNLWVTIGF